METQGYLSILLHGHLPFVRHPEHEEFFEEDWLFEAITECYLPLLAVLEGLLRDGIDFRLTLSLSPTLCAMLGDPLLQRRYRLHLERLLELACRESDRTIFSPPFPELARFYRTRLEEAHAAYVDRYRADLPGAFRRISDTGKLELISCGATHGYLPLLAETPEAVRAQILIARDSHRALFGEGPRGFWLPECAYDPGIEAYLREAEIRWFVVDTHGLLFADPRPRMGFYAPVYTPHGPAAFARDVDSSREVWSASEGYPGDFDYREFYRDIGFELDYDYLRPYLLPTGERKFLGIKYYRITGATQDKEPYSPEAARAKAALHAEDFLAKRRRQVASLREEGLPLPPIILAPYDAELFGHWWYEGPQFLDFLFREIASDPGSLSPITPSEYLERHPTQQLAQPASSSWGWRGHSEVWLDGVNDWIYPHLHEGARRLVVQARRHNSHRKPPERLLRQAARELLLAQASDWAFLLKTGTASSYAKRRTETHLYRLDRLCGQLENGSRDLDFLRECERRDNLFPDLDWRYFA
ncbi:glycoside hydrolase family 57 protein [Methylacidimicrobium sp. B4]|uniref:glycoside hydrolase family 57 protein n=1 Tax=Methylacidimicrobium sp. B4 TaxID=2796139 RepID=UPI001A8CAA7B|nr:1,4-alpha-glucan branching protein domain-containing protein [Methylacidimicrobium sp. B4]QSR85250.1 DUF1957 domain-containing protein [Methylacidimicrobium sp. B4]